MSRPAMSRRRRRSAAARRRPATKIGLDISSDSTNQPAQSNVTIDQFKAVLDLPGRQSVSIWQIRCSTAAALASIVWSSSNPSIAFVDADGYVVAIAPGAATVTVVVGGRQPPAM
ncbi:MAG: Ig-like domain-containing protein [Acutalibacteraceae bacterium]